MVLYHIIDVPRLSTFDGTAIFLYADDHAPPHVHAYYGEHEVLLVIADGSVLVGSLPHAQLRKAQAWVRTSRTETMAMWDRLNGGRRD